MPKYITTIKDKPFLVENDTLTPLEENKVYEVIEKRMDKRSVLQNSALHKYFSLVAESLNGAGFTMQKVLTQIKKIELTWSTVAVKEVIWREFQKASLGKESTTQIEKNEIDKVYLNVDHWLTNNIGIESIDFPSEESLIMQQRMKEK